VLERQARKAGFRYGLKIEVMLLTNNHEALQHPVVVEVLTRVLDAQEVDPQLCFYCRAPLGVGPRLRKPGLAAMVHHTNHENTIVSVLVCSTCLFGADDLQTAMRQLVEAIRTEGDHEGPVMRVPWS
jgi:hypothetical protein